MDDTFTILQSSKKSEFLKHLNSIDEHIQFTSEEAGDDGSIPFLDVLITPDKEGNLTNYSIQKAYSHGPVPPMGQQPHSGIKIQCGR